MLGASESPLRQGFAAQNAWDAGLPAGLDSGMLCAHLCSDFIIFTAELNSAYDNSALRSELTCHLARPPEGGFAGFVPFGRSPFGDCACSERMNRPCANKVLLRKTFETPDFRRKTPHPRRWQLFPKTIPPKGPSTGGGSWRRKATEGDDRDTAHQREHSPYLFRWEKMRWK